jgi:hypothetical protein
MAKVNEVTKSKLLIVEGTQDLIFFTTWISLLNRSDQIQVMQMEGKSNLPAQLKGLAKQSAFIRGEVQTLVVVRDADQFPDGAFQSVCGALEKAGLAKPRQPYAFAEGAHPRTAVMIIPASDQPGAIEELVIQTIQDDPILPDVREFIQQAVDKLPQPDPNVHPKYKHFGPPQHRHGKAQVHAFLATFDQPDRNLGVAARAGVWNFNHPALGEIQRMLEEM